MNCRTFSGCFAAATAALLTFGFASACGRGGGQDGASAGGSDNGSSSETPPERVQLTSILHMGQSLASGDEAFPVVTVADTGSGNFQFSRGVHTWREQEPAHCVAPESRPDSDFDLVPILGGEPITHTGETIASGLTDQLKSSMGASDVRYLFTFAGQGSKRLRELDKRHDDAKDPRAWRRTSGGYYNTSIDDIRRAKAQADRRGWAYSVGAITWMQGEKNNDCRVNDWSEPLDRQVFLETYADDLIVLKNDWNTDICAVTGQGNRVPLFTYQTWGAIAGQAQLLAMDRDPEIFLVSPTYYMQSATNSINPWKGTWGDPFHLSGDSQRWLGAQFAKVIKRVLVDGEAWQPLRPLKAWVSPDRSEVSIRYWVPRPPLVIETSFLPAAQGAGFSIHDGPAVTGARVSGPDTVTLTLAKPLPDEESHSVEYASEHGPTMALAIPTPILSVREGEPLADGQPSYEVVFPGNILPQLSTILQNGAFRLKNTPNAPGFTVGVIRSVTIDGEGNTAMKGALGELRNATGFQPGQLTTAHMILPLGNLRDSDPEASIYRFAAGPRAGQPYPLWNWSVSFEGLLIAPEL